MHRRFKEFERRLARLAATLRVWSGDGEQERKRREMNQAMAAILRAGLECAGVDPDEASALRHLEAPEPPRKPFAHPLRRLAERQRPRTFIEALNEATKRYHGGPAPDLHQASAMQLIGYYCFGAGNQDHAARAAPA